MPPKKRPTRPTPPSPPPSPYERELHALSKLIAQGNASRAVPQLERLTRTHPNDGRIFDLLCTGNSDLGKHAEAVQAGARATKLSKDNPHTRTRYALALQAAGHYQEALLENERALYLDPKSTQALRSIVSVHTDLGDHDAALKALDKLEKLITKLKLAPEQTIGVSLSKARLSPKALPAQPVIDELTPLAENESLPDGFRVIALSHIGRLYESLDDIDRAFEFYTKSNELQSPTWDPDVYSSYIDALIRCWTSTTTPPIPSATKGTIDPTRLIFITGMMRSGTSLTEQMLAQLPDLTAGGEMNAIARTVASLEPSKHPLGARAFPVTRAAYTQQTINTFSKSAATYYHQVAKTGLITDKQPYNYLFIPLIAKAFPGAKIIHTARDPLDTCLSNFVQNFARPHPQTNNLYWLGRYYADYERVMNAWHSIPDLEILDVNYEDTVTDPEAQSKRVCAFIDQPWTEDILNFHTSSRTVRTASRDQVRQPLYTSSVKKYQRFESHLDPLKQGLEDGRQRSS